MPLTLKKEVKIWQKGIREKLLCDRCEGQFAVYEKYVSELSLFGELALRQRKGEVFVRNNVDYNKFKLFQLSCVWRAHESKHEIFKFLKLGVHAEKIRLLLLEQNPGGFDHYPRLIYPLTHNGELADLAITQPVKQKSHGLNCYSFYFRGIVWLYFVDSRTLPEKVRQSLFRPDGPLIFIVRSADSFGPLADFSKMHNQSRGA